MFYSIFYIFVHLSYCALFAAFYRDIDEITESLQKLYERVGNQSKTEEDIAKEEIRIKEMQDKIDELVEHQRIFDILLTRYEARIIELEGPKTESIPPKDIAEPTKGYVDYEPYN
jgi:hypothetical protein